MRGVERRGAPRRAFLSCLLGAVVAAVLAAVAGSALGVASDGGARAETAWYPVEIDVWTPPFNTDHRHVRRSYTPPLRAQKPWRVCAVIPHLKDDYWLAVNFGLVDEARRLGISLNVYESGGYENLAEQRAQVAGCIERRAEAIVIGAVSASGLDDLVQKAAAAGIPVIDLINGMNSTALAARVAADFYDMGHATGLAVRKLQEASGRPLTVGWFPGPSGAGWVADGDRGFRAALEGSGATILAGGFGDTGGAVQARLVRNLLREHPEVDVLAGTAVTAEAAIPLVEDRPPGNRPRIFAYYFGAGVARAIRRGLMVGASSDRQALLARIAVDQAVNLLEKRPIERHVAVAIEMVDAATIGRFDLTSSLAPVGYKPIFSVRP